MQKRFLSIMLAVILALTAIGCGDENKKEDEKIVVAGAAFDVKGSDYVTLCDFSKIPVKLTESYVVTDADVEKYFDWLMEEYGPFYKADGDKTVVGEGDIVCVDYVGKYKGEEFSGGTAKGQYVDVYGNCAAGGNKYIAGFTDGLKGASVGDVIDHKVTFPENYSTTTLAGKDVTFTFTVKYIAKEVKTVSDADDAFAKEQYDVDTLDEMLADMKSRLQDDAETSKKNKINELVQDYLMEKCTVEIPEGYVEARLSDYRNAIIRSTCNGNPDKYESYINRNYSKSVEEIEAEWRESFEQNIALELILDAIAEEKGYTLDEEDYQKFISDLMKSAGYASAEKLYTLYGYGDAEYGERYLRDMFVYELALEAVVETAQVTEYQED